MAMTVSAPAKVDTGAVLVRLAVLAVASLALGLRLYRLAAQSLWYDEAISLALAGRSLAQIAQDTSADIHPPLYYFLLHFWIRLAGDSEFAARFVSAAASVIAVPLVYQLGRQLFTRGAGLAAAALLAAAPVVVYYGQEARMYSLLLTLSALWTLIWLRLLAKGEESGRTRLVDWGLYVAGGVLCLYTHYFGALVLAFHGLWTVLATVSRPRIWLRWLLAEGLIVVSFLPWLMSMSFGHIETFRQGAPPARAVDLLWRMLDDFTVGHLAAPDEAVRTVFLVLLVLGVVGSPLLARAGWRAAAIALLYSAVPTAALLAISAQRPAYEARLLFEGAPGFYLLVGAGVAGFAVLVGRLFRPLNIGWAAAALAGAALLAYALLPLSGSLQSLYEAEAWRRDDFRGLALYLAENAKPEDAIILDSPGQIDLFRYYFRGSQRHYLLPVGRPADRANTEAELKAIVQRHPSVWAILWGEAEADPEHIVERWLDAHAYKTTNPWYGGIRLARYVVSTVGEKRPLDVRFGDSIRLRAYAWQSPAGRAGEVLPLTLYWEATAPVDKRYTVFVHILDDQEKIWGQRDSEPGGGAAPTTTWVPGRPVEDRLGLPIQPDTAPGVYQVEVGLYYPPTMERPQVFDSSDRPLGNRVLLAPIEVK